MYPISDMLVQKKNAQAVGKEQVLVPSSKIKLNIAQVLKDNGFVSKIEIKKKKMKKDEMEFISIDLKYDENDKSPGISDFKIISKPSRHLYISAKEIKPVNSGYGIGVISTPKG